MAETKSGPREEIQAQVQQKEQDEASRKPRISVLVPLRIQSSANLREHWTKKRTRDNVQELQIRLALRENIAKPKPPLRAVLTRIAPKALDYDNLVSSLKRAVDTVADWITPGLAPGRADSVEGVEFFFKQERGKVREYGLKIEIWDQK